MHPRASLKSWFRTTVVFCYDVFRTPVLPTLPSAPDGLVRGEKTEVQQTEPLSQPQAGPVEACQNLLLVLDPFPSPIPMGHGADPLPLRRALHHLVRCLWHAEAASERLMSTQAPATAI